MTADTPVRTESEVTLTNLPTVAYASPQPSPLPSGQTSPFSSPPSPTPTVTSTPHSPPSPPPPAGALAPLAPHKRPKPGPKPTRLETALCLLSAHLLLVTYFGLITSFGALQPLYQARFSKSAVSWIGSVQSTLGFFPSFGVGLVFDRFGPRWLCVAGSAVGFLALVGVAYAESYHATLLSHALYGLSASLVWTPAAAIPVRYTRRSYAIGLVGAGSGLGGFMYPFLLQALFRRLGFERGMLVLAGFNLALNVPSWLFLRPPRGGLRLPRLPDLVAPEKPQAGVLTQLEAQSAPARADTATEDSVSEKTLRLDEKAGETEKHVEEEGKCSLFSEPGHPGFRATYGFLLLGVALSMLNMFSPYFDAALLPVASPVAILQAGSAVGRFSSGLLADRFGVWRTFLTSSMGCAVVLLAFWLPVPLLSGGKAVEVLSVIGLVGYGLTSGAWVTLVSATCASISPRRTGARIGLLWSVVSLPILPGPVLCSVIMAKSPAGMLAFCAATFLLGSGVVGVPALRRRFWSVKDTEHV